ncbi:hypothetical protein M378DRAFT_166496, partial [Amanita muscaria Koide BX008]
WQGSFLLLPYIAYPAPAQYPQHPNAFTRMARIKKTSCAFTGGLLGRDAQTAQCKHSMMIPLPYSHGSFYSELVYSS